MKITITHDFSTVEEAAQFLARVGNQAIVINQLSETPIPTSEVIAAFEANRTEVEQQQPKTRKPRSDAGKPRGAYKPRETTTGEPASDGGGQKAVTPASQPATPTTSSAPAPATALPTVGENATAPAAEEFPATLDGARAAMKKLNDAPGLGMDACIASLKAHGVNRISDLPKEKFAEFIKYVLAQVPAAK